MGIFRSTRSRARLVPTMPSCALEGFVSSGGYALALFGHPCYS